jgi:hypothetical protein
MRKLYILDNGVKETQEMVGSIFKKVMLNHSVAVASDKHMDFLSMVFQLNSADEVDSLENKLLRDPSLQKALVSVFN